MVPPCPPIYGLLSKGRSVTTQLGIYRAVFAHAHPVSGAHYIEYFNQQAVDVWNYAKHH